MRLLAFVKNFGGRIFFKNNRKNSARITANSAPKFRHLGTLLFSSKFVTKKRHLLTVTLN